ncbi:ABC transporter permease [Spiroplasma alleghenense]|uniref:ABC transporter permease n=1 Tax=Spiroplasma alleghenense TaxID=216931 RepID=A0A345Z4Y9_9MOLU|nr:ABC transporter permease [Spiroplasma alleghenense]AXK51668.1 ABC transporter permease [Spiroplasma alleghenense]
MKNNNFKTVFNFSLLRVKKNIPLIIISAVLMTLIIILNFTFLALTTGPKYISTLLIINVIISVFWLGFFNINNTTSFIIGDLNSGIQSLEIRRGATLKEIFWSKLLANKIISFSWIILVYLAFIICPLFFNKSYYKIIVLNYSFGIFSLLVIDLLITAITLSISCFTKSYKKSIPVAWIFVIMSMFSFMFAIVPYVFTPVDSYQNEIMDFVAFDYFEKHGQKHSKLMVKMGEDRDKIVDLFRDEDLFEINTENELEDWKYGTIRNYFNYSAFELGFLLDYNHWIKDNSFQQKIDDYLINLKIDEKISIKIDNEELKSRIESNFYLEFLEMVADKNTGNKKVNFKNSLLNNNSRKNLVAENQFNDILKNFNQELIVNLSKIDQEFDLNARDLKLLVNALMEVYFYKFSWKDSYLEYGTYENKYSSPIPFTEYFLLNNWNQWYQAKEFSYGTNLLIMCLEQILWAYDMEWEADEDSELTALNLNYQINPAMWFVEMILFSHSDNPLSDSLSINSSPMPILDFQIVKLDKKNKPYFTKRPFSVTANYLVGITMACSLILIGYFGFLKRAENYKRWD